MQPLHLNGIDAISGAPLVPPLSLDEAAELARTSLGAELPPELRHIVVRGVAYGRDPARLDHSGWALVLPAGAARERREALAPLLDHRSDQAGPLFKILDVLPDESPRAWLARHGMGPTDLDPEQIPYYLLLVGDPTEISFEFQYTLAVRHCVGRLALDPRGLAAYATSVVRAERSPPARRHQVDYWAPRHDPATALSADHLVGPLHLGGRGRGALGPAHRIGGATAVVHLGQAATRPRLLDLLHGRGDDRPALLFTASHGLGFPAVHPRQPAEQGALLCQEWPGLRAPDRDLHTVTADHIGDDADLHGLIAFLFACFGAGTPAADEFLRDPRAVPRPLAPAPFLSALPTRLLAHPRGGALAVVGHVERAWGCSIFTPGVGTQILPFHNFVAALLDGKPVGLALRDFAERHAVLSVDILDALRASTTTPQSLVARWLERNDARSYILLGDPAVRLPRR